MFKVVSCGRDGRHYQLWNVVSEVEMESFNSPLDWSLSKQKDIYKLNILCKM